MRSLHLLYHELRPSKTSYTYVTTEEEFEAHCVLYAHLQKTGTGATLRPEITFDDGHRSDATLALPLLGKYGLRATFFITAGWTGQRQGFMDWTELRLLHEAGHRIGAHGMHHKLLTRCSDAELEEELRSARRRLEDGLGCEIRTMSLPGGRFNARVLGACERAGYTQVFTSAPRAEAMEATPRTVGRLNLRGGTTAARVQQVLEPASGALARLERAERVKGLARGVLGDQLYARLWALGNRQEPELAKPELADPELAEPGVHGS